MNHWRLIRWLAPGFARKHEADALERKQELERMKAIQGRLSERQEKTLQRLEALEAEVKLMGRGVLR